MIDAPFKFSVVIVHPRGSADTLQQQLQQQQNLMLNKLSSSSSPSREKESSPQNQNQNQNDEDDDDDEPAPPFLEESSSSDDEPSCCDESMDEDDDHDDKDENENRASSSSSPSYCGSSASPSPSFSRMNHNTEVATSHDIVVTCSRLRVLPERSCAFTCEASMVGDGAAGYGAAANPQFFSSSVEKQLKERKQQHQVECDSECLYDY